jgi:hypothetical protein
MSCVYAFQLPTTGSLSFADYFTDGLDVYTTQISEATQARANLRAVLKESKHTDGDKDYLKLVKASLILVNLWFSYFITRHWRSTSPICTQLSAA